MNIHGLLTHTINLSDHHQATLPDQLLIAMKRNDTAGESSLHIAQENP